jgi:outer membrane lipase/esterase
MTKFASRLLATAAVLAGAAVIAAPAQAQRVDRIVAFGDSYADDGNLFELLGIPRPAVYPNGRFSNGTNFIDTLALILGRPVDNFAIGGAFTGNGNINGPGIPGFVTEYQSFLAGGGPAAFPRVTGKFGPRDLVAVSIGGNDARAYERSLGLNPSTAQIAGLIAGVPAQAQARVAETAAGLNALVGAGARNITFLAGDVGRLPEVVGLPVAAVGSAYASAYNAGLQPVLSGIAAQGVIVNYLDLNRIGDKVAANLAAFGLRSAGAAGVADLTGGTVDQFLFYVDQVHLTSAGFAIVGRYAARQLEAPLQLEPQVESALHVADGLAETLGDRLDLASAGESEGPPLRVFVNADFGQTNGEDTLTTLSHRVGRHGASAGVEYQTSSLIVGAAINYTRGETEFRTGTGRIETDGLQGGVYAHWDNGNAFIEGYAGIGQADLEITRTAVIDEISASPQADTTVAGAQIGYLFDVGSLKIGPTAGIGYTRAELEAFTETGDAALTLNVQEQEDDALVGNVGIELNGDFDMGGARVSPFLIARAEKELEDDARTIRYALTTAPTIVNQWVVGGDSDDPYGRLTGGANFSITSNLTLQVTAGTTIDREGGDDSSASVALRMGF